MHEIAQQLNERIRQGNPHVYDLLSDLGKELYYPKGILTQTAEAKQKAYRFNATIGIATENGLPMYLPLIQDKLAAYSPNDLYTYAPPAGKPELRKLWREKLLVDNPSLQGKTFGQPIVTNALTHGLSLVADLFMDSGDPLVLPEKLWGNYRVIFGVRRNARIVTYPFFTDQGNLNVQGMKDALFAQLDHGKAVLLLNFPNNPTGYTPTEDEAAALVAAIREAAEAGLNLVVVTDDAYFGLFYEDSIKESLFGRLTGLHPRILTVKVDGATKEEFVWGFRVGFITYGCDSVDVLQALEQKTMGLIRGTISNASHPAQTFVLDALKSEDFPDQIQAKYEVLRNRAVKVKQILQDERYQRVWDYYPFNSGYFMCLRLKKVNAEKLRQHMLDRYGVGLISLGDYDLRVAFSCVDEKDLPELFDLIYQGVQDLEKELE